MAKTVEPTRQELDSFISVNFNLDRDRGYDYAYHICGWRLPASLLKDREQQEALARAMMIAHEEHDLGSLECVVNCSDTPLLGVRLYSKDVLLENIKTLKKLQRKDHFPLVGESNLCLDYSANNPAKYTTLVYGKHMSREDYDALREATKKWPANLNYHEVRDDRDTYEEGAVGFEVSSSSVPTKKTFTAWDKKFEPVGIDNLVLLDIW